MDPPTRLVRLDHGEYEVEQWAEGWQRMTTAAKYEFMGEAIEGLLKQNAQYGDAIVGAIEALDYGLNTPDALEDGVATAMTILEGGCATT